MEQRDPNEPQDPKQSYPASSQTNGTGHAPEQAGRHEPTDTETETAEYYQTFLTRLLTVVSHGQPETVNRLIEIIRSGASQQQVFEALSELGADDGSSGSVNRTQTS
ncbi:hypothetical protein BDW62DRAFT_84973 [Aspergillus aurantiobrunneus]